MNRYAIIENGVVRNIVVGDAPLDSSWIENPPADVKIGCLYDGSEFTDPALEATERSWRDAELARTDAFIVLPDFPYLPELTAYRTALRDYDFSGARPEVPVNSNGNPIC